jgi:hypothetical protein
MARLLWVAISNGFFFWWGVRFVLDRENGIVPIILGILICSACVTGAMFELRKQKIARAINIGIPTIVAVLMVSYAIWLPMLAKSRHSQYVGETSEGAVFLLLFALCPICLAAVTYLVYSLIEIEPSQTVTSFGLK